MEGQELQSSQGQQPTKFQNIVEELLCSEDMQDIANKQEDIVKSLADVKQAGEAMFDKAKQEWMQNVDTMIAELNASMELYSVKVAGEAEAVAEKQVKLEKLKRLVACFTDNFPFLQTCHMEG